MPSGVGKKSANIAIGALHIVPKPIQMKPLMNTNIRLSGWAMIAGTIGVLATLVLHPSERGLFDPSLVEGIGRTMIIVHSLALVSLPLWFMGGCGLSKRIGWNDAFAVAGLIVYGFALAAMTNALVIDGLVTPGLARAIANAAPDKAIEWKIAFNHNAMLDQAFVNVFLAASSAAITLWSVAILRTAVFLRIIGIFGCLLGVATIISQLTGELGQHPHIFFLVLIGQAIWFLGIGLQLCRAKTEDVRQDHA